MLDFGLPILDAIFITLLVLFCFFRRKMNWLHYWISVLFLIVYFCSLAFFNFIFVSLVYERDTIRRSELVSVLDRAILLDVNPEDFKTIPMKTGLTKNCMSVVEEKKISIEDLVYGQCTFRQATVNAQFDRLWWLGRDRVIIKFPRSAYRIPWIKDRVDSAIKNPCRYIPQNGQYLNCDKGFQQHFTTLLVLTDSKKQPTEKIWFYRHKWEEWLP